METLARGLMYTYRDNTLVHTCTRTNPYVDTSTHVHTSKRTRAHVRNTRTETYVRYENPYLQSRTDT